MPLLLLAPADGIKLRDMPAPGAAAGGVHGNVLCHCPFPVSTSDVVMESVMLPSALCMPALLLLLLSDGLILLSPLLLLAAALPLPPSATQPPLGVSASKIAPAAAQTLLALLSAWMEVAEAPAAAAAGNGSGEAVLQGCCCCCGSGTSGNRACRSWAAGGCNQDRSDRSSSAQEGQQAAFAFSGHMMEINFQGDKCQLYVQN